MLKIAAPAVWKAKQIICYRSKQSHAKAKLNLLTSQSKKKPKVKNRFERISCIPAMKDSLIFDFCYLLTIEMTTCSIHNATSKPQYRAVTCQHRAFQMFGVKRWFWSTCKALCLFACVFHVCMICLHDDHVCAVSVSQSLGLVGDRQSHQGVCASECMYIWCVKDLCVCLCVCNKACFTNKPAVYWCESVSVH